MRGLDYLIYARPDCEYPSVNLAFNVTWDKDRIVTERSHMIKEDGRFQAERIGTTYLANSWNDQHRNPHPYGFPIHAHCWTIIERIIGQSAEDELELFLPILFQRWEKKPLPFEVSTIGNPHWLGIAWRDKPEELDAVWDPIAVPEIRTIIRRCTRRVSERIKMRNLPRSSRNLLLGALDRLPLDVVFQILDYLPATDIESFLAATGWHMPDAYWRARFPRKLIFEVEEEGLFEIGEEKEKEEKKVNWQVLCLEIEKLLEDKGLRGLQNRQRIFGILEETKGLFLSRMLN